MGEIDVVSDPASLDRGPQHLNIRSKIIGTNIWPAVSDIISESGMGVEEEYLYWRRWATIHFSEFSILPCFNMATHIVDVGADKLDQYFNAIMSPK